MSTNFQQDVQTGIVTAMKADEDLATLTIEEGEDEEVRAMFETNFFGLVALTRQVLPGMRARGRGHQRRFAEDGGRRPFP